MDGILQWIVTAFYSVIHFINAALNWLMGFVPAPIANIMGWIGERSDGELNFIKLLVIFAIIAIIYTFQAIKERASELFRREPRYPDQFSKSKKGK